MCGKNDCGCDGTKRPRGKKPEECTPEEIKACHGEAKEHPSAPEEQERCCE